MSNPDDSPSFEIGLVMAGAVSAGAYTAGVVDFLIQALDSWYQARQESRPHVPPHDVRINVMSGASAGGMTAAITSAFLHSQMSPVEQVPQEGMVDNKLYESWVQRVDISELLQTNDLKDGGPVVSLLDSTVLDRIGESAFAVNPRAERRPYVADPLHLYLSVTNLAGVPYTIAFRGPGQIGHRLWMHGDYMRFAVGRGSAPSVDGALGLDAQNTGTENWEVLKQAALASGAFPIGLAPRRLSRPARDYEERTWPIPLAQPRSVDNGETCQEMIQIPPSWGRPREEVEFLSVDGGLMNNEPLELARQQLSEGSAGRNPRDPGRARKAVLMVDPFPSPTQIEEQQQIEASLPSVFTGMFSSLKAQARFKPDELALAVQGDVYSRFMIAPSRGGDESASMYPLACGSLGAFGGFLSRDFRDHDFMLGRRNCQNFLRRWFAVPEDAGNPLFSEWTDEMKSKYGVERDGRRFLPIIPLVDSVREPVPQPSWPTYTEDQLDRLVRQVKARGDRLVDVAIDDYLDGWFVKNGARLLWRRKRGTVLDKMRTTVREDLTRRGMMAS